MMRGKIITIHDGAGGGDQTHALTLIAELKKRGFDTAVVSLPKIMGDKVTILSVAKFFQLLIVTSRIALRLVRAEKRERPLIIHVHGSRIPLLIGYFVHIVNGAPLVVTIHGTRPVSMKFNRLYSRANKVIAITPEVKNQLQIYRTRPEKIVVIPNMIDTERFSPTKRISSMPVQDSLKIVSIGRLDVSKEHVLKIVIELMPMIIAAFPSAQLLVIGDGPRRDYLYALALEVNRRIGKEAIITLGHKNDVVPYMLQADIMIGVGRVALEAMSCGKPLIVASQNRDLSVTGGLVTQENILQLSKHNFSGRNHTVLDSEKFSSLLLELLRNGAYRTQLGLVGREFIKQNRDATAVAKEVESVYINAFGKS